MACNSPRHTSHSAKCISLFYQMQNQTLKGCLYFLPATSMHLSEGQGKKEWNWIWERGRKCTLRQAWQEMYLWRKTWNDHPELRLVAHPILPLFKGWSCFTNHGGMGHGLMFIKHILDAVAFKTLSCFMCILLFNPLNRPQWARVPSVFLDEKWSYLQIHLEYEQRSEDFRPYNFTLIYLAYMSSISPAI